jgi:ABC-type antimicrobial peptide transport system permease subunit
MGGETTAAPGEVSGKRIVISLVGIVLGISVSFFVTGLRPAPKPSPSTIHETKQGQAGEQNGGAQGSMSAGDVTQPRVDFDFSWRRFGVIGLISLVICGISYQGLYYSLRLYQNEPALLILFVSFQYGYFWQSAIKGGAVAVAGS